MATTRKTTAKPAAKAKIEAKTKEKPTCSADGCDRVSYSKGLCIKHYTAERRKDPLVMEQAREASRSYAERKRLAEATAAAEESGALPGSE